jgi:hypothetical protein
MPFGNSVNEERGVKSSPRKEFNNSMNVKDARTLEY